MAVQVMRERSEVVYIPAEKLRVAPCNVRKVVGDLTDLIESIKEHGILEPLICRPAKDGTYEIVAGRRRFEAGLKAGLREFPCIIKELDDVDCWVLSYSENLQRQNLDIEEEVAAMRQLYALLGSQERIAKKLGVSRQYVAQILEVGKTLDMLRELYGGQSKIVIKKEPKQEEREKGTLGVSHALLLGRLERFIKSGVLSKEDVEEIARTIAPMSYNVAANFISNLVRELEIKSEELMRMKGKIERIPISEVLSRVKTVPVKVELPVDLVVKIREKGEDESKFIARVVEESIKEETVKNVVAPVIKQAEEMQREVVKAVSAGTPSIAVFDVIKYVDSLAELLIKGNDEVTMDWVRQLVDSVGREKLRSEAPVLRRVGQTLIKMADYIEGGGSA